MDKLLLAAGEEVRTGATSQMSPPTKAALVYVSSSYRKISYESNDDEVKEADWLLRNRKRLPTPKNLK